ncbi:MAG: tyrosine-type recombinase/integrase [Armatimonadetes bacterium]|nr:tyrosine-type recombinase/integrase [Armatimonadota bacterium]MDW8154814.1 tyrosine-type recombinase/integrase [Armatimonadota bacterium]
MRLGEAWTDHGLVCPGENGAPWWPNNFQRAFSALTRRVGVEGLTFHVLRHTHASHLIRAGVDLRTVAARLGHATPTLTLNTYGHLIPGAQEEAVSWLEEHLHGAARS